MVATRQEKDLRLMRRGTRACRECRRRKVKCIYENNDDDGDSCCQECKSHKRDCVKQGIVYVINNHAPSRNIKVQIARLESAAQKLARERPDASVSEGTPRSSSSSDNNYCVDTSASRPNLTDGASLRYECQRNSPIFSLFHNDVFHEKSSNDAYNIEFSAQIHFNNLNLTDKQKLMSTIEDTPDVEQLLEVAGEWWISWREQHFALRQTVSNMTLSDFVRNHLNDDHAVLVAVGLLAIATALQNVRFGIDDVDLKLPIPTHHLMYRILSGVDQIVCDNKEYQTDPRLILVMMMRAKHHVENNQLRKGWLRVRQAVTVAQMIKFGAPLPDRPTISSANAEQQRLIGSIIEVEWLMSMVLGFPYAQDDNFTDARALNILLDPSVVDESLKMRSLRRVVAVAGGKITDRNTRGTVHDDETACLQATLDLAATQMPTGWWDLLLLPLSGVAQHRYESIMAQLWFYTVQAYLHLPYLVEPKKSSVARINRQLCLDSTRNLVRSFNYLRSEPSVSVYMCNCDDFQGLLGACILLVGILQDVSETSPTMSALSMNESVSAQNSYSLDADIALIEDMKDIFRYRVHQQGGGVSKQGLAVLEELTSFLYDDDPEDQTDDSQPANRERTIMLPYFGTIKIELTKKLRRVTTLDLCKENSKQSYVPTTCVPTPPSSDHENTPPHMETLRSTGFDNDASHASSDQVQLSSNTGFDLTKTIEVTSTTLPSIFDDTIDIAYGNTIDWNSWDHFMFGSELDQDWNPSLTDIENMSAYNPHA